MSLSDNLGVAPRPVVVLTHDLSRWALESLEPPADASVCDLGGPRGSPPEGQTVVLAVRDRQALRQAASLLPDLGKARWVVCWLKSPGGRALVVVPRPSWPRIEQMSVDCEGEALTSVRFAAPVAARSVLLEIVRRCTDRQSLASTWPIVALTSGTTARAPTADPSTVHLALAPGSPVQPDEMVVPPDVVLRDGAPVPAPDDTPNSVTGRAPVTVTSEPQLSWNDCQQQSPASVFDRLQRARSADAGLDEQLLNPIGFRRDHDDTVGTLVARAGANRLAVRTPDSAALVQFADQVREADLPALRRLKAVRVGWRGGSGPQAYANVVAGLAMAGVPLVAAPVPGWARLLLDRRLVRELERPVDVDHPLRREEASIRLRRAALKGHASRAWRSHLAAPHVLPRPFPPRVSVLLSTRRPEMVDFAVRQVTRQRGVDLELILATHGFDVDRRRLLGMARAAGVTLEVVSVPAEQPFGMALNLAARRASGDLLAKMDDDDWYGPEFLSDLVLARAYSGAELVGVPSEFNFLRPLWLTIRRPDATEQHRPWVAGGTMMIERTTFADVGGFRPNRRYVDAGLLSAVLASGASVYRGHGLGYVLRRVATGHTWDPGLGYFLQSKRVVDQWRGFSPSALLEPDPVDLPQPGEDSL